MPKPKTAVETLVALGVSLASEAASSPTQATCKRCKSAHDPKSSQSRYPTLFCDKQCEREFIRKELAALTLDDCIRLQQKLEHLLKLAQEPLPPQPEPQQP